MENNHLRYYIKLNHFEGPFDLLLFFIERDELDIYDIPISKITNDFLDYIRAMEQLNIDLASDFIVMAARLMKIKTQMLLPRHEQSELSEGVDPRMELTQRLVEYKKIKEVAKELQSKEEERSKRQERGTLMQEVSEISQRVLLESEWESISIYGLFHAFQKAMTKMAEKEKIVSAHKIFDFDYNIQDQRRLVQAQLKKHGSLSFDTLFWTMSNRIEAIVTFLALLEMLNDRVITLKENIGINQFWIFPGTSATHEEE